MDQNNEQLNKIVIKLTEHDQRFDDIEDKITQFKDEILTSNDKLSVKLDRILTEQAAHTATYRQLEKRVSYLETVVKIMADKIGVVVPNAQ